MTNQELEKVLSNYIVNSQGRFVHENSTTAVSQSQHIRDGLYAIMENVADTLFVTDNQGVILYLNAAYEKLCGETRDNLLGRNVIDLIGKTYSESATAIVLKNKKQVTIEQTLYKHGRLTYVTSHPIFDNEGNIVLVVSTNRDFTEIAHLKTKLEDSKELISKYQSEIEAIKSQLVVHPTLVATDKKSLDAIYKLSKIARFDSTVLLLGETGTGKEEFAKYVHSASIRRDRPFIKVNCGAIVESLIESEFFGYEKGAFTGANSAGKLGLFEVADTGTLFLDEIGELPLDLQVKLLRVLQDREVIRIGGTDPIPVDVRIISATNADLNQMVKEKRFREDLFYRLNVVAVTIPPLRNRRDDIIPLAKHFLGLVNEQYGLEKYLSNAVYQALLSHSWPGNVRELRNVIEQAIIMSDADRITPEYLPFVAESPIDPLELDGTINLEKLLRRIEYKYISSAYERCQNVRDAAASLTMATSTYVRKRSAYQQEFGDGHALFE